jgi:uncharacterized membrane protein YoaK (UPF0700 family)
MPAPTTKPGTAQSWPQSDETLRLGLHLSTLLSIIAGAVDVTGFLNLGNLFPAHVTGNLVMAAALAVRGGPVNLALVLSIPVFILALAAAWLISIASGQRGPRLVRLLLLVQLLLLTSVLIFSVVTRPSTNPHGLAAGIAGMGAVFAMACQFVLFRLALPGGPTTAVMTSNLTNTVVSLLERLSAASPSGAGVAEQPIRSLHVLIGFVIGCIAGAVAVSLLGDWAWSLPAALAGLALVLQ